MNSWESSARLCRQGEQELPEKIKFSLMIFFSLLNPNITNWSLIRASVRQTTANDLQSHRSLTLCWPQPQRICILSQNQSMIKKRLAQAVEHGSARVQRRMISRPTDKTSPQFCPNLKMSFKSLNTHTHKVELFVSNTDRIVLRSYLFWSSEKETNLTVSAAVNEGAGDTAEDGSGFCAKTFYDVF